MDDPVLTLLAEQSDLIAQLQTDLAAYRNATPEYWEGLYDRIEHAMEDYCLAVVGQRRPHPTMVPDEALRALVAAVL